jgi:Zn/Cd-binding protein ZinT
MEDKMKKFILFILLASIFSSCATLVRQNHEFIDRVINNLDSLNYLVADTTLSVYDKYDNHGGYERNIKRLLEFKTELNEFHKNGFHVIRVSNMRYVDAGKLLQIIVIKDNKTGKKFTFQFLEEEKDNWKFLNFFDSDILKEGRQQESRTIVAP